MQTTLDLVTVLINLWFKLIFVDKYSTKNILYGSIIILYSSEGIKSEEIEELDVRTYPIKTQYIKKRLERHSSSKSILSQKVTPNFYFIWQLMTFYFNRVNIRHPYFFNKNNGVIQAC